jgi:AraC family transcriptional regulator
VCHGDKVWRRLRVRCQNPTLMSWDPGFPLRPTLLSPSLLVGEWHCPGEQRPWAKESTRHWEIAVQRLGVHLRQMGRERYVVDPLLVTLNAPGDEYMMASPTVHPQRSTIFLLSNETMDELASSFPSRTVRLSPSAAILHHRLHLVQERVAKEELALSFIRKVLADGAHQKDEAMHRTPPPAWRRCVEEIQQTIALRHAEQLSLSMITASSGFSPSHASRVFRRVTGLSIYAYLLALRLRVAMHELKASEGELTRLALASGFSSHSHFTQAFRKAFGVTPSELKRWPFLPDH